MAFRSAKLTNYGSPYRIPDIVTEVVMDYAKELISKYKSKVEALKRYIEKKQYPGTIKEQQESLKNDDLMKLYRELRQELSADPYRPIYHFGAANWFGDPNGLCYWQGKYHIFYQGYLPGMTGVCWGHAVSDDLVRWQDLPFAFAADKSDLSCFSGQTWVEEERVVAIYHGKGKGNCIAESSDPLLLNRRKNPGNPVIPDGEPSEDGYPYRVFDPCIWKEEDGYYSLSGTSRGFPRERRKTCNHLFHSKDLTHWDYLHPLVEDDSFCTMGDDGACPNFRPIGNGKHILTLFSHRTGSRYYIGDYDKKTHKFTIDYHRRFNHNGTIGSGIGTPSVTVDHKGRNITIFNYMECYKNLDSHPANGVFSLPLVMKAKDHFPLHDRPYNELKALRFNPCTIEPAEEVESLRFNGTKLENISVRANEELVLKGIEGRSIEIRARLNMNEAREAGFYVLRSPGGEEKTKISVMNLFHGKFPDSLIIDTTQSSLRNDIVCRPPENAPIAIREDHIVELRIFIDRSLIEVFVNSDQFASVRVLPDREDSRGVSIFAKGDAVKLLSLESWQMRAIEPWFSFREGD